MTATMVATGDEGDGDDDDDRIHIILGPPASSQAKVMAALYDVDIAELIGRALDDLWLSLPERIGP